MSTTRERRKRDSHVKTKPAKAAAEVFVDHLTTHSGKGVVADAAQAAYPNQSRAAARVTGARLLTNPIISERIAERRRKAAEAAGITRQTIIGLLAQIAEASHADLKNEEGDFDWEVAKANGLDHLIQEEDITVRTSKDGSSRTTRKYKLPSKIHAIDLLAEITGIKKLPAKNPVDAARENFLIMRQKEIYKDMSDEELAVYPAAVHKVSVAEILEGQA